MWLVHLTGLEQMGYKGGKNGMHCYRRLPRKNVPLMESEKIKEGDPFLPATPAFSDAVDFAPARNHQDGTKLIAMSSVSEEETQEKEDSSFSPDLALLFVVEEQIWGRLSNSVKKEDPEGLEGSQQDPETWSESSEGERNPCIQEARNTAFHLGEHGAVSSLSIHQSSLVNSITPAQVPSSPSEVAMGQVEAQVLSAGFPQALDLYDTFSEAQGEQAIETKSVAAQKESDYECLPVSRDISKCHQYTESFEAPSSVNHSWERDTQQEMSEGILESVQAVWDTKMHPHTEGADEMEASVSTKNEEQKVREFQEEREDEEFSAPSQSRPGSSEDRRIDADTTETEPGGILSLISSKVVNNCLDREETAEGLVENSNSAILHFLDKEEDDEGKNRAPSLKEITKTTGAESHIDCGESEADPNEFLQKVEPESAETEALDLGDKGWSRKEEILDWKGMENKIGENDKPELEHDAWEGQQQDMEVEETSREKAQRKMETAPVTLGPDTLLNLTNNVASPDVNQNSSFTKVEGFAVSLEQVYPSSHCTESTSGLPESCVQATGMPFAKTPSEGLIPKTKPPVSPDPRPLEDSSMYDKGDHPSQSSHNEKQPTKEDRKCSFETEVIQSSEDEKSARGTDGEGMESTGDLVLPSDPEDLYDPQPELEPVDVETHLLPTSPAIPKAPSVQQVNASKGPSDGSSSNALLCEKSDALEETPNQNLPGSCHMDLVVNDEDSAVDSDMAMHDSSKESSFIEDVQNSAPPSLQNISLGEELRDTVQKTVELGHDLPCATQYLVSFHKKDTTAHYFKKSYQHQDAPIGSFVFPGKDTGADTLYMEQQPSNNESGCFSDCGQNGTEDDPNTDSTTSLDIPCAIATDVTQLTKPLTSVPVSEQTLAFEHTTTHLGQLALLDSDYRQSVQPSAHPHNTNVLAHTVTPHDLHPKHPSHHEEQLSSSSETSQFLGPITSPQSSTPSLDAGHFEQPTTPRYDLSQDSQAPESLLSSNEPLSVGCAAIQSAPMPTVLKKATICSLSATCIASQPVQVVQLSKSSQSWECIASESNKRLSTEDPDLPGALNKDTDCPYLTSSSSSPLSLDANQSVQHAFGAPIPNLPIDCTEGDDWARGSVPVANLDSQMTPSVHGSTSPSQLHNMESSVEVQLAKSEGTGVPRDVEVGHLGTHSDSVTLGNDTFAANNFFISETISRDTHDGKGSALTLHHLVENQKRCEVIESQNSKPAPLLLAFTNPIHFLQPGPPSPPTTRHPQKQQAEPREPPWWQATAETAAEDMTVPMGSQRAVEDTGRFRVDLGTPVMEPSPAVVPRKDRAAKHLPLEKSSSCPYKNVAGSDTKGSTSNSKRQEEERIKYRTKSKDWHRQGVRKTSIPTESVLEGIASLVSSKEDASAQKDKTEHFDRVKYGDRTAAATVENFKRRHSKLINSSRLLYQEYSDVALNKAIQNQKRDSLSEEVEPGTSPDSPRLRRKALTSQDSYLQRLSVSSSVSLWQDIPMVRGSTMLLSMTREEQKLQEAKFELIASEASYLRSLNIAVDHFQHSQELQAVLSNQDRQWLFSRLQDVRDVSANFLFDLEEKLEENMFTFNVCDVALRHAPEFRRVYLPYVTNQTYQEQTFQRLMNGVPAFQQVLEKLESDPVCQRLSLKSFLILPFQRITRLKLLLQNILKRTRPGAEEEIQATQAYDALEKLIKDCNENVQRMKSTEELIYLSKNMAFECKIFPLISQSRRLVKHGELTALEYNPGLKWKLTTRSIYLHLFNDYLLLSRPRENGRFIVFDYAASSDVRGEKCEMKLHGTNKNVFRLFLLHNHQGKKVEFLFRTETQSEKLRWISALSPQQIELDFLDDPDALQVQGVKSYKPRENDELALEKADIIMVLAQSSDGWLEGVRLSDGEKGWFPLDHVDFISSKQVRQMNLKEEQRVKKAKQQVFHKK